MEALLATYNITQRYYYTNARSFSWLIYEALFAHSYKMNRQLRIRLAMRLATVVCLINLLPLFSFTVKSRKAMYIYINSHNVSS